MSFASGLAWKILLVGVLVLGLDGITTLTAQVPAHAAVWENICYPPLEVPGSNGINLTALIGSGSHDDKCALRVDVLWSGSPTVDPPAVIAHADQLNARIHLPDGTIIEPTVKPEGAPAWTQTGGRTYDRMYQFPWGPNRLDEAWVELRIGPRTYWLEVPYGLVRDPHAPLAPAEPTAGPPVPAPAMQHRGTDDRIVSWTKIGYDLGVIQKGWRLALEQSNSLDAHCEVTLYREDSPQWEPDSPKTSVTIAGDDGGMLVAQRSATHVPDFFRRVDDYSFPSGRKTEKRRNWGTLTIRVDDESKSVVIPSSLYKHAHGVVEVINEGK